MKRTIPKLVRWAGVWSATFVVFFVVVWLLSQVDEAIKRGTAQSLPPSSLHDWSDFTHEPYIEIPEPFDMLGHAVLALIFAAIFLLFVRLFRPGAAIPAREHKDKVVLDRGYPRCPRCKYQLKGSQAVSCPECGRYFSHEIRQLRENATHAFQKEVKALEKGVDE